VSSFAHVTATAIAPLLQALHPFVLPFALLTVYTQLKVVLSIAARILMTRQRERYPAGNANRPLIYRDIAKDLRDRIVAGRYSPGAKLPSLSELIDEFAVSSISIRRALSELAYEGLIEIQQGRGAFVKLKGLIHRVIVTDPDRSIGNEIERAGFVPRIEDLGAELINSDNDVADRLEIKRGSKVWCHRKLVFADAEPVSLHFLYFTRELADRLKPCLANTFVFRMMQKAGLRPAKTRFEFSAEALKVADIAFFKLPAGSPIGALSFTPLAKSGRPILTGTTLFRSDRVIFELDVPQ
jgi:DNA-binding GntR family transcriptional regulator